VPEHVYNSTREAPVDPDLQFMVVEKADGRRATVVSYAAHAWRASRSRYRPCRCG